MWGIFRRKAAPDGDPDTPAHLRDGRWGERQAERFLKRQGLRCLGRNVRFGPREELDLVMRDKEVLVFVEVKTRRGETYGRPGAAVTAAKRRLLSRAAVRYLRRLRFPPVYLRFDVVEVVGRADAPTPPVIRHLPNAFPLDGRYLLP